MVDKVLLRVAELRAQRDAHDAELWQGATQMRTELATIVSEVSGALRCQTGFGVRCEADFDEYGPEQGWVSIFVTVLAFGRERERPILVIEARQSDGVWDYSVEGQADGAYLSGTSFEVAHASSRESAILVAVDVVVETLAQWIAGGVSLAGGR